MRRPYVAVALYMKDHNHKTKKNCEIQTMLKYAQHLHDLTFCTAIGLYCSIYELKCVEKCELDCLRLHS